MGWFLFIHLVFEQFFVSFYFSRNMGSCFFSLAMVLVIFQLYLVNGMLNLLWETFSHPCSSYLKCQYWILKSKYTHGDVSPYKAILKVRVMLFIFWTLSYRRLSC
jgi:hypothetical protein